MAFDSGGAGVSRGINRAMALKRLRDRGADQLIEKMADDALGRSGDLLGMQGGDLSAIRSNPYMQPNFGERVDPFSLDWQHQVNPGGYNIGADLRYRPDKNLGFNLGATQEGQFNRGDARRTLNAGAQLRIPRGGNIDISGRRGLGNDPTREFQLNYETDLGNVDRGLGALLDYLRQLGVR